MSHSTAKDIAGLLATQGYGTEGTNIFVNIAPDSTDNMIEVNDTGGFGPLNSMGGAGTKPNLEVTGFQVRVRNNTNQTAHSNIYNIYKLLDGYNGTLDSVAYLLIQAAQTPFILYKDENERYNYACNFICERRSP